MCSKFNALSNDVDDMLRIPGWFEPSWKSVQRLTSMVQILATAVKHLELNLPDNQPHQVTSSGFTKFPQQLTPLGNKVKTPEITEEVTCFAPTGVLVQRPGSRATIAEPALEDEDGLMIPAHDEVRSCVAYLRKNSLIGYSYDLGFFARGWMASKGYRFLYSSRALFEQLIRDEG